MPHPRFTGSRGSLNRAGLTVLATMVRDGASTAEMAEALGLSYNVVSKKARDLRIRFGIKAPWELERETFLAQVAEMLAAGGTNESIAAALGRDDKSVSLARQQLGLGEASHVRLSAEEYADVDRRLIAGERPRVIAESLGMHHSTISKRRKVIGHLIPTDFPPCRCGRPHNHDGACRLAPEKLAYVREQLAAGRRMEWIGPEVGLSVKQLREYALPMIAELQAAGVSCPCGRLVSHGQPYCHPTRRTAVDPAFQSQVRALLDQGLARLTIAKRLGCSFPKVNRVAKPLLVEMAARGVTCPCGATIDHGGSCGPRSNVERVRGFRFSKGARGIPPEKRLRASRMACQGERPSTIRRRLDLAEWPVEAMFRDLGRAGRLPRHCVCGREHGHQGSCASTRKTPAADLAPRNVARAPTINDPETERHMLALWRKGVSTRELSRRFGLHLRTVQRFDAYWRSRKTAPARQCACGRPFRHSGGCIKNTPGAVTPVEMSRIDQAVRGGRPLQRVATELGLGLNAVLRHSQPLRDELFGQGITCGCGRLIGHPNWCSAKWDLHERPRGRQPLPSKLHEQAVSALIRGDLVNTIAASLGVGAGRILHVRRELPAADRSARAAAIRARARQEDMDGTALFAVIDKAVPRGLGQFLGAHAGRSIRDGVVGEIFAAVREGRVELDQLSAVVKSFMRRGLKEWADDYGPTSLDGKLGDDGARTLGDLIGDTTAELAMDEIEIGQPPP